MTQALVHLESDDYAQYGRPYAVPDQDARQAFADFYARFHPRLLRYARRVWGARDAEEIAQETLVRAYEAIDLQRDERSLWGWLVVVGRNVAADMARARRMCDVGAEDGERETTVDPKCVEQSVLDRECLSTLGVALAALPPSQSRAWWLSVAEGMTPTVIAESLACSPEAVRQALFKSRKRLAAAMADFCDRSNAFVAPSLLLLRRFSHRAGRQLAPAAANGFLGAAIVTSSALTVTVFGGGAHAPATAPHQLTMTSAAVLRHAGTPIVKAARPVVAGAAARQVAAPHAPQTTGPVHARARVSSNPLAPGEQGYEEIFVRTAAGTVGVHQVQQAKPGDGLVCGRVDAVHCGG